MPDREDAPPMKPAAAGKAWYLIPLLLLPVAYRLLLAMLPDRTILGWDVATLSLVVGFAAAIALWLPYRTDRTWPVLMRVWLLSVLALWLYIVVISVVHDSDGHWAALLVALGLVMIYLRPPSRADVWRAGDVLAWAVLATGALHLVLEAVGLQPSWYRGADGRFLDLIPYDRGAHWLPIGSLLGLDGRWGGILEDPNLIGPLGVLLTVYAFGRRGWNRAAMATGGLVIVVLADSRASYGALAVALVLMAVLPGWSPRSWLGPRGVALLVGLLCLLRLGVGLRGEAADSGFAAMTTMTGRTTMWPDFLSLLDASPITGVGTSRILAAVESGELPPWSTHGHNQFLDGLVRYGWVGALLSTGMLVVLLALAVGAVRRRTPLPLALLVAFVVVSIANVIVDWRYPDPLMAMLLLAAMIAATPDDGGQRLAESSNSVATSTTSTPAA